MGKARETKEEPIFSRQEQGVVYLFSRYWEHIDLFKNKRVSTIQIRFPDAAMTDTSTGESEAIEFEYNLSAFYSHLSEDRRSPGDLKKLKDYAALYIVYWDQDTEKHALRTRISRHFPGKIVFVCLHDYFVPSVKPGPDRLVASWEFCRKERSRLTEVYSYKAIREESARLERKGVLACLNVQNGVYRVAGFNKGGAEFIECDHWKIIHFYTTTSPIVTVPSRLFVKPTGFGRFTGCFEIKDAFRTNDGGKSLGDYFQEYYFYPYDPDYDSSICFLYSHFTELSEDQGVRLFNYLKDRGYRLGQTSEIIQSEHNREVDKIALESENLSLSPESRRVACGTS